MLYGSGSAGLSSANSSQLEFWKRFWFAGSLKPLLRLIQFGLALSLLTVCAPSFSQVCNFSPSSVSFSSQGGTQSVTYPVYGDGTGLPCNANMTFSQGSCTTNLADCNTNCVASGNDPNNPLNGLVICSAGVNNSCSASIGVWNSVTPGGVITVTAAPATGGTCGPPPQLFISSSLPSGTAGTPYPSAILVYGGTPPYTISAVGLPSGLSVANDGTVSGTPSTTDSGPYSVTVSATDAVGASAGPKQVPITINPQMCTTPAVAPPVAGSQWYQLDSNWSSDQYDSVLPPTTIGVQGCALTALTYALDAAGQSYNPGSLNTTLTNIYPGDYSTALSPVPGSGGRIIFGTAVPDASFGKLKFDRSKTGSTSTADLNSYLCATSPVPVIAQVTNPSSGHSHYVVVTGQEAGGTYSIVDPGYNPTGPNARTSLSSYGNQFQIVGVVKPPSGTDPSELDFSIVDNATLLVTAPDGTHTGIDPATRSILKASTQTAYFAIDNSGDTDQQTEAPTSTTYSVQLFLPTNGTYTVTVEGLKLGPYNLSIKSLNTSGLPQTFITLPGIANLGSTSTFQVQFNATAGSSTIVTPVASFKSALADVANSKGSGLIKQPLIAEILTALLDLAEDASNHHDRSGVTIERDALQVFRQIVTAASGKTITGVAPKVLTNDATSLIAQIP